MMKTVNEIPREQMKPTPAPWRADGKRVYADCSIAKTYGSNALANARLIAAAPDLLAALKSVLGDWAPGQLGPIVSKGHAAEAFAAITKATQD